MDGQQEDIIEPGDEEMAPASKDGDPSLDMLALRLCRALVYQDQEKSDTGQTSGVMSAGQAEEPERDVSPSSLMDTCAPSISSLSSSSSSHSSHHHPNMSSSSSSSALCLTPPLPPSVELPAVLTDTRLTLDVYLGGSGALPLLWGSIPERLRGVWYLRLGSEDKPGLDGALDVLPFLTELRSLAIRALPPDIGRLSSLTYLSILGNELVSLPSSLGQLKALQTLDISHNLLQRLPDEIGSLEELVKLELSHNKLKRLPESMGSLLSLRELVIFSNDLRLIPQCLTKLPLLKIDVRDNPLGKPPSPPPLPPTPVQRETRIPELHLGFNQHSFSISSAGCHVFLPGGAELLFPPGCLAKATRLEWVEKRPERKWVRLEEHDILLSRPLELRPHGVTFLKLVYLQLACCSVRQFSWFMAVSRLVKDSCSVTPAGALLVSSADPGIKLHFPPDSTVQTRTITLQTPSINFLQPIKVQVPLPAGVTGHTVDMSCLHLLHGDPTAQNWTDITSQVSLYVTHLYAIFYITHFSWYWLWYTTQRCVSGVVRKVYQKLKQFRVQFLVLQRKTDPSQVMLQCLPSNKVEGKLQLLLKRYDGPQPSDLCDLLEGEQFFAGFERGLDVSTETPECMGGRLSFVFYSNVENRKEVFICPDQDQKGPVRGQALNSDNSFIMEEPQYPPLNLGDPESGYLTEANLLSISLQIGQDWHIIGMNLGISYQELDRIKYKHRDNLGGMVLEMLFHWARGQRDAGPGAVSRLVDAMIRE
ncbi:p53-induced death domain-containing protein 1 [Collichthys lucidus]|uniref:p53-induced death domain-containing protein 1 n=1 Tax=Collichthys lucidus TaxID=240159 RepID=A0A4U5UJ35_COLLU|nr:p53-induced death domain-containing protein 1 [Collichthys lucidus]